MELILAEQTLLIALDDEKGRDSTSWGSDPGLAAALLLDLARHELVVVDADGRLAAVDGPPPGHELLREAHAAILGSERRRNAKGWVGRLPHELKPLRTRLARGLVERGILTEQRTKFLGLLPTTRFPAADERPERELRERLHQVLVEGREPSEDEALLIGLLEPLELIDTVVERDERRAARKRAKAVAEQGIAGRAVRDAVASVQAAVIAAVVASSVAATSST
ncbi:GOLPH3/VPS74 family protein [Capillimicrobium parvum]|uniref:GPP34 family phosphoprotein n=1 Tax=Capillimicrobium parvum TaxID=2884022 RepID=A0A9E7C6I5_9ACTN|nr:GPP34 family phosphoprotein [Capillimicrobium parvum]UGS38848.1 hypothetical protein DSM104329_05278 [Capillimicrobium parvum]